MASIKRPAFCRPFHFLAISSATISSWRAGRGIDKAHIVLMHGPGDDDIQRYFIETAFPTPQQVTQVIDALRSGAKTRNDLQRDVNVRFSVLEKILTHLEVEEIVEKRDSSYVLLKMASNPDYARWAGVTQMRYAELEQCMPTCMRIPPDALYRAGLETRRRCRPVDAARTAPGPTVNSAEAAR